MFLLLILVTISAIIGALGGSFTAGYNGILLGATSGMFFGSIAWYIIGTIDRILHERRLDSFFSEPESSHSTTQN